ncbi:porin [Herbaspirillum sp. alder98]|uniref:porin n=1 Tax=Herbaspirillum sp. alder98 TaxID=2913096 RepID=UPI001CD82E87|nr:porin [Herbaspirillum sp. alder98]MCA1324347.1 porin [Herbaspirillum sp. alder98]
MKKHILAASIAAPLLVTAFGAHAQSSVTIYGIINPSITYTDKVANATAANPTGTGSRLSMDTAVAQGSRLGFKGVEELGGGLKALFTLENGFNADTGAMAQGGLLFGRTAVVGLSGSAGTLLLGRQKDYIDDLSAYNGALDFGSLVNNIHALNLDRSQGARVNNSVRYNSPNMGGVVLSTLVGFGEQAGSVGAGQSFGLGGSYTNGGLSIGAAYFQNKLTTNNSFTGSSDSGVAPGAVAGSAGSASLRTFLLGGSWRIGNTRLYGSFSQVRQPLAVAAGSAMTAFTASSGGAFTFGGVNNSRVNILDLGVNYSITPNVQLLGNVVGTRSKFVGAADGSAMQLSAGVDYFLSKRTDVYLFYANIRSSGMINPGLYVAPGGSNTQNVLTAGIRHKF